MFLENYNKLPSASFLDLRVIQNIQNTKRLNVILLFSFMTYEVLSFVIYSKEVNEQKD
jgi:hypothetical protein